MSISRIRSQPVVLVVSDDSGDPLQDCGETLKQRGCGVYVVPDVYAAMAYLARGLAAECVLLDVCKLDDEEARFLELAPRYFEGLRILVLQTEGVLLRLGNRIGTYEVFPLERLADAALSSEAAHPTDLSSSPRVEEIAEPPPAEWQETDADLGRDGNMPLGASMDFSRDSGSAIEPDRLPSQERAAPDGPLSTDGGLETAPIDAPLHEAVRKRMSGLGPPVVRRKPPGGEADPDLPNPPCPERAATSSRELISEEELKALLYGASLSPARPAGDDGAGT